MIQPFSVTMLILVEYNCIKCKEKKRIHLSSQLILNVNSLACTGTGAFLKILCSVSLVGQLGFCLLVRFTLNGPKAIDG